MNHCEMVWTTAGTNRVCGRCLSLKDTVVGHTNEQGVQLPPIHPRCRCTISYRELTNKPTENSPAPKNPLTVPEIQTLVSTVIKPDNPSKLNALLKIYATDEYVVVDNASKIPAYYDLDSGKIVYNPNHTALKYYNLTTAFTHEVMHLIDIENGIAVSLSNAIFTATEETKRLIFERKEHYEQLLDGDLGLNMSVSDLVAAITGSQIHGAYAHNANYWLGLGHTEREIVANLATIHFMHDAEGTAFIKSLPPLETLFEEVKQHYETNLDTFSRRRIGVNASRSQRISRRAVVLSA